VTDLHSPQDGGLIFSEGFIWERGFVKRASLDGRMLYFRISVPFIANFLADRTSLADPVRTLKANESAIEDACRRALAGAATAHRMNFDLSPEDFSPGVPSDGSLTRSDGRSASAVHADPDQTKRPAR
jgi:hypothetical protein